MPTALNHFKAVDCAIFAVYLLATVGVGMFFSREQKSVKTFLLADRNMGSLLVGISVLAALFSGISYLAVPSEIYSSGIGWFIVGFSYFIATPLTAMIFLPFFCRSRFYTAYQYFDERFGIQVRLLASLLFMMQILVRLAIATYVPALVLQQIWGVPMWFTILCTGVLTTLYASLGGMKAVIWTDVIQFVVLMGGQLLIMLIAASRLPHGLRSAFEIARENGKLAVDFSLDPRARITIWGALIGGASLVMVQMATDQVSVQRYLTAKSLKEARRALWIKLGFLFPVIVIFTLTGLVLYAFYQLHGQPKIGNPDEILPYFVANELPTGIPGLLVAAICGATMAAVSSGINSLTTISLVDFYERLWQGPAQNEQAKVKLARWLTFAYGVLIIVIAFQAHHFGKLIEGVNKAIGVTGGPLMGMFFLGMFTSRANGWGVLVGWIAGVAAGAYVCFCTSISFLWFGLCGLVATFVVGMAASLLFPEPTAQQLDSLTWETRFKDSPTVPANNPD